MIQIVRHLVWIRQVEKFSQRRRVQDQCLWSMGQKRVDNQIRRHRCCYKWCLRLLAGINTILAITPIRKIKLYIPTFRYERYPTVLMLLLDVKRAPTEKYSHHASQVAGTREVKRSRSHRVNTEAFSIYRIQTWLIIAKNSSIVLVVLLQPSVIWALALWAVTCCKPIPRLQLIWTCHT